MPTAQEMIDGIRHHLTARVDALSDRLSSVEESQAPLREAIGISLRHARTALADFENLLRQVPDGFRLEPVLYTRTSDAEKEEAYEEFLKYVRKDFFAFLVENHEDELRALGIGNKGIKRMKQGRTPCDENGNPLKINVDHIIERGGSGVLVSQRGRDRRRGGHRPASRKINHIANLVLLPEQIHAFKNNLNAVQNYRDIPVGECRWILMLVPVAGNGRSGYVAAPQKPGHPLSGLFPRTQVGRSDIAWTMTTVDNAYKNLAEVFSDAAIVSALSAPAQSRKQAFNEAVLCGATSARVKTLRAMLVNVGRRLWEDFNEAACAGRESEKYKIFIGKFTGEEVANFRRIVALLPLEEAENLLAELQKIEEATNKPFEKPAAPRKIQEQQKPQPQKKTQRSRKRHKNRHRHRHNRGPRR